MKYPTDNPYSPEKEDLGKKLFFDPILSTSRQIACATCHDSELGWADGRSVSVGHRRVMGRRNAPTILNVGYLDHFFWDGRAHSLEEQALFPIQDPMEMDSNIDTILHRLRKDSAYITAFAEAFETDTISELQLAQALATFQRSIVSRKSRLDLFMEGDYDQLDDLEILGLHLFRTKAKCMNCHHGPLMTDQEFHNDGFAQVGRRLEDLGKFMVTRDTADIGLFKTPGLRDVGFTAPYMHNGTMPDLLGVIEMYNQGMPQPIPKSLLTKYTGKFPDESPLLHKLHLTQQEKKALVAFMHAISTRPVPMRMAMDLEQ
jgi:cytochrome c peroxidase